MISAIGLSPVIAAPMAAPMMACSESAHDGLLGDRRVAHPLRSELLIKTDRRLEHAAGFGDVFAEEDHVGVARHFLGDAARHGVAISQFRHAKPPSA